MKKKLTPLAEYANPPSVWSVLRLIDLARQHAVAGKWAYAVTALTVALAEAERMERREKEKKP